MSMTKATEAKIQKAIAELDSWTIENGECEPCGHGATGAIEKGWSTGVLVAGQRLGEVVHGQTDL